MLIERDKLEKYREAFDIFSQETKKLFKLLPSPNLSHQALKEWYQIPENRLHLHNQLDFIKHLFSELHQAWQELKC